ncbi:pentatricopeptide repeat protein [Talaromyces stipitatus ATCC 10500]|uniref:Pentatricopeptide repeat protein n=1 Tax=Talaromyces stipitatus (strain ATCC 10500 / CBS 375.48 / QM 6759 / NRRL 1006) TaxID=441959 RepID=B8M1N6_TALSN|nr:pentatricopeptide repeat protein [Talaromyces stipitatus ATCC 10500]EED22123.1 pentatricopeptide repeat protein [Talaromyces stipitatus ATCC 10500]
MVFKPFTHLARQNFAKAFTHGYAQSVVAASQSTYASSSTTLNPLATTASSLKFHRTSQLQSTFQNASSSSGSGAKAGQATSNSGDSGLAAYYAAWQHAQQTGDDSDWRQFQFKRRIGWKPKDEVADKGQNVPEDKTPRDLKKAAVNVDVSAKVEEAVAREIQIQEENAEAEDDAATVVAAADEHAVDSETAHEVPIDATATKSIVASGRVVQLAVEEKYADIPAAFEAILRDGVTPTVEAYNSLLQAAIKLHSDSYHAVPKALDVYSDMLRRRVIPNQETYKTLIAVLVSRAVEISASGAALEKQRIRFGGLEEPGKFLFRSSEIEKELVSEDHSLTIALKLFDAATSRHSEMVFPLEVYKSLIITCAEEGRVEDMIRIYAHMETQKLVPHAAIFPSMIRAFAKIGDLKSAVECYNEYRELAMADDNGVFSIVERRDGQVYAALVGAYFSCGKSEGGMRFFERIRSSYDNVQEDKASRLEAVESTIIRDALVQSSLDAGNFEEAVKQATSNLQAAALQQAMAKICVAAADAGSVAVAVESYDRLAAESVHAIGSAVPMLALHVRQGNVLAARTFWAILSNLDQTTSDLIQPTTMYAVALLKSGHIEEGLMEARKMFGRIRKDTAAQQMVQLPIREEIDEAIELLGRVLMMESGMVISAPAAMTLVRCMVENGGLVSPIAEHAISSLGPMGISELSVDDLTLALQVQAGMIINHEFTFNAPHLVRFAHMVDVALSTGVPLDVYTSRLVDQAILKFSDSRPDLVRRWQDQFVPVARQQSVGSSRYTPVSETSSQINSSVTSEDSYDPYAYSTDYRGSSIISDELEATSKRIDSHLNEALTKLRNIRRLGRHPRYITYAKLINAAAKCGRMNIANDILAMARHDVPLLPQYSAVRYGWSSILDAMVAACLTVGERDLAAQYHQELLQIGSAPSANTFGLYITTLKESTKTFDEATEAVKIFHRAIAEGVEPTSFLYNALIGKLGKARRIDDCLLYFAEMRSNGVRPTSVTYGTIVNALCRVSDERFAEEMFDEMESMPNYKPRPAPYNSMIQYFLNTKRDRSKILAYYERMRSRNIEPTMHTYKLLIDAHASLEPVNMEAAEQVLETIKASGQRPEAVHYASLIHAKGCVLHDMDGARALFDSVISNRDIRVQPCLYQALFEAMVANGQVSSTTDLVSSMGRHGIEMTPYIANTLIQGWAAEGNISKAYEIYNSVGIDKREPSTYEAMTRAFVAAEERPSAAAVVQEMLSRGYPAAVAGKIVDMVGSSVSAPIAHF